MRRGGYSPSAIYLQYGTAGLIGITLAIVAVCLFGIYMNRAAYRDERVRKRAFITYLIKFLILTVLALFFWEGMILWLYPEKIVNELGD